MIQRVNFESREAQHVQVWRERATQSVMAPCAEPVTPSMLSQRTEPVAPSTLKPETEPTTLAMGRVGATDAINARRAWTSDANADVEETNEGNDEEGCIETSNIIGAKVVFFVGDASTAEAKHGANDAIDAEATV